MGSLPTTAAFVTAHLKEPNYTKCTYYYLFQHLLVTHEWWYQNLQCLMAGLWDKLNSIVVSSNIAWLFRQNVCIIKYFQCCIINCTFNDYYNHMTHDCTCTYPMRQWTLTSGLSLQEQDQMVDLKGRSKIISINKYIHWMDLFILLTFVSTCI